MAEKHWETVKVQYCDRAGCEVSLDAELVYPAEYMPDQPARLVARRCSNGLECNQLNSQTCVWAGTNPMYDPFKQK
jgi:hypothetical protein